MISIQTCTGGKKYRVSGMPLSVSPFNFQYQFPTSGVNLKCIFWINSLCLENIPIVFILEKAMAPHSSTLAWKIPWTEEPGGMQSMGSLRIRHHWATSLSLFPLMNWRRKWHPTPVFLPEESKGRWSLVGCHLWGCTELDTTGVT